jgi:hypothetical protein
MLHIIAFAIYVGPRVAAGVRCELQTLLTFGVTSPRHATVVSRG